MALFIVRHAHSARNLIRYTPRAVHSFMAHSVSRFTKEDFGRLGHAMGYGDYGKLKDAKED